MLEGQQFLFQPRSARHFQGGLVWLGEQLVRYLFLFLLQQQKRQFDLSDRLKN
jgi:hypothetical protein